MIVYVLLYLVYWLSQTFLAWRVNIYNDDMNGFVENIWWDYPHWLRPFESNVCEFPSII